MKRRLVLLALGLAAVALALGVGLAASASGTVAVKGATKELKIGVVTWLGWPVGLSIVRAVQVEADVVNKQGGLLIGKDRYKIKVLSYDTNNSQATETAAVNKAVFEDKVKFIFSDGQYILGWNAVTEQNKVLTLAITPLPPILSPKNNYTFQAAFINTAPIAPLGWFAKHFPNKKKWIVAYPDNQMGHVVSAVTGRSFKAFGLDATSEFYPVGSQDLSALGTKVKVANPDVFDPAGAGPVQDALALAAVYQAGYRGTFFVNDLAEAMAKVAPVAALEGAIGGAKATEFNPPLTKKAKEFVAAYKAKYGKWDSPTLEGTYFWDCLVAGLQQSGSVDPTKVAAKLSSGMKYLTVEGPAQMIARPDLGNNRTVDTLSTAYLKMIIKGKATLLGTIKAKDVLGYFKIVAASGPPPGPPPG